MKVPALAVSILILVCGAASATDAPPTLPSWAGFYIGGHGGYGWSDDPFLSNVQTGLGPLVVNGFKSHGWVGGGHFGYNWQYGAVVGGLELDISATGIGGNSDTVTAVGPLLGPAGAVGLPAVPVSVSVSLAHDLKLLASARGRLGWTPNSDWLFYGTGGLAWERLDQATRIDQTVIGSGTTTTNISSTPVACLGWVLGTGVEARLANTNWIARLEYLHYDFGHTRSASSIAVAGPVTNGSRIDTVGNQTIDVVRAGLSYKFGS